MNKQDILSLLKHTLSVGAFWQLEYAKKNVIDSEYQKIKQYREKFDAELLRKGVDIINGIEAESNIVNITMFFENYKIVFTTEKYSSNQLHQILTKLEESKDIETQNATKKLYIEKGKIIGYDVTFESDYSNRFKKNQGQH